MQSNGNLDYGWRQYMPDLGRWNGMDQLAEGYHGASPYVYVMNNPASLVDPDGRWIDDSGNISDTSGSSYGFLGSSTKSQGATNYRGLENFQAKRSYLNSKGGGDDKDKPGVFKRIGNFFRGLVGGDKGAGITTIVPGAAISRIPALEIGNVTFRGILSSLNFDAIVLGLSRVGLWSIPLMLTGDSGFSANSKPITGAIDISGEISKGDNNKNGILLYRGVSSSSHSEVQANMYNEALFGIAIPNGLRPENIHRAHWDMDDHAMSDNISVWTSWTTNKETARYFARGVSGKSEGVILSKRFKIGVNAIPNVSETGMKMQENEWLIFGPVIRANVEYIKP